MPCLRQGNYKGQRVNAKVWWQAGLKDLSHAHTYRVELSPDRQLAWPKSPAVRFVVAMNVDDVKNLVTKKYSTLAARYSGMAKSAWSRAMMLVSDRPSTI